MSEPSLLQRLKERKLVQWALAYLAGAFVVVQLLDAIADPLGLPSTLHLGILTILGVGFLITLVFAWYHGEKGRQRVSGPELLMLAALFVVAGSALTMLLGRGATPEQGGMAYGPVVDDIRPSLAVLPFANMSPDSADAYFADGVHEEILTQLAKISGLRLVSRTSVMGYRETNKNLRQIAEELGVHFILEGSVRRFGDRVRITGQLIDAGTDGHLWADSYERSRADLFAIQADVAERIAEALQTELSPAERALIGAPLTDNTDAHDQYLRAREYNRIGAQAAREARGAAWRFAIQMYENAVELDPSFAAAWAGLAFQHLRHHWYGYDSTPDRTRRGRMALDRAEELDPGLPEVRVARGYYLYWGLRDYAGAEREYRAALELLPGDVELFNLIAFVQRRQGRLLEAAGNLSASFQRDPRNANVAEELGNTYRGARSWDKGEQFLDRTIALAPDYPDGYMRQAELYLSSRGDTGAARRVLEGGIEAGVEADLIYHLYLVEMIEQRWDAALEVLNRAPEGLLEFQYELYSTDLLAGLAHAHKGDTEEARNSAEGALGVLERLRVDRPEDFRVLHTLGVAYALLGRKQEAIRAADRSVELQPMSLDAWAGGSLIEGRAWIYALVGETDDALTDLEFLVRTPTRSWITPDVLRLDPRWDPLRDHPRFQALLEE